MSVYLNQTKTWPRIWKNAKPLDFCEDDNFFKKNHKLKIKMCKSVFVQFFVRLFCWSLMYTKNPWSSAFSCRNSLITFRWILVFLQITAFPAAINRGLPNSSFNNSDRNSNRERGWLRKIVFQCRRYLIFYLTTVSSNNIIWDE